MAKNKYYTTKGNLTSYALSCGYCEARNNKTLSKIHGIYKVASLYEIEYFETIDKARKYLLTNKL